MDRTILYLLIVGFLIFIPKAALCDEISEVKAQMQKIQEENKVLQEQLDKQRETVELLLGKIEALEKKDRILSKDVESLKEKPMELALEETELPEVPEMPKLKIRGFSDIGFEAEITDDDDSNTFSLGEVDLFINSDISDRMSFMAETHFHFNADTNAQYFHIARANLRYSASDLFNIKVGSMHTPLGYWNQTYHHGTWLQTTVFRPEIYRFEDDKGGFLPVHSVGIELFGLKEFGGLDLEYDFGIFNGRDRTVTEIQHVRDKNDSKAINTWIGIKPHFIEGLKLGADIYLDRIPSNPGTSTRTKRIDELIVGGFVTYTQDSIELLGEAFNIYHEDKTSASDFDSMGFYLQGGYRIDKIMPYYRFDFMDFANGDPYFSPNDIDIRKHTLGLRWDIWTWNALKFEYSFNEKKDRADEHSIAVNSSFTF